MQISENLPQFEGSKTLILVCSKQSADVYTAEDGEIETLAEIRIENPEYSDREGHFKKSMGGKTIRSGAVYEDKDSFVKDQLHNQLNDALENVKDDSDIKQVIVLCPSQLKNELRDHLPSMVVKKIDLEIAGNYVGEHPTDILEHIQNA